MKSNEEMVSSLLERRDEYEKSRARTRKKILTASSVGLCLCAAALAVALIAGSGAKAPASDAPDGVLREAQDSGPSAAGGKDDTLTYAPVVIGSNSGDAAESSAEAAVFDPTADGDDVIILNESGSSGASACFAGEKTSRERIESKFDFRVIPSAPADLTVAYFSEQTGGENGDLYWYDSTFSPAADSTEPRWLSFIVTNRDTQTDEALRIGEDSDQRSVIGGTDVWIYHYNTLSGDGSGILRENDNYICRFEYRGQYFWVDAHALTLDEVVESIGSIVG